MRIAFDTNVLLAGVFTRGVCEALLDACVATDPHVIIHSEHILDEFARHAKDTFGADSNTVESAVELFRSHGELVRPSDVPKDACRDPDDLPVLGTAVAGRADALVNGDQDLLALGTFGSIPILSPREIYDRLISS